MIFKNDPTTKTDDFLYLFSLPIWIFVFGFGASVIFLVYGQPNSAKEIFVLTLGTGGGATQFTRRGGGSSVNVNADRSVVPISAGEDDDDLP